MFILRPIHTADLDDFVTLVSRADHGLTSLPKDRSLLRERIAHSMASMAERPLPRRESSYLFVLIDTDRSGLAGCCGCYGQLGGEVPYFAYERATISVGEAINMPRTLRVLRVVEQQHGPAMLGSLLLDPGFRGQGLGRFLSLTRMLFLADHPLRFDPHVIAELRGWLDENGSSPFWEALGRHFFRMSLPEADLHTHTIDGFVHHLLPRQPIIVDMLPEAAQQVIGAVHASTQPAMDILKDEGFILTSWLDPFEAGPVVAADVEQLRTVRTSRLARIVVIVPQPPEGPRMMVSNRGQDSVLDYRVAMGAIIEKTPEKQPNSGNSLGEVQLDSVMAEALGVQVGDRVRIGDLPPSRRRAKAVK